MKRLLLLGGGHTQVRRIFERTCSERSIAVHAHSKVTKIEPGLLHRESAAPLNAN